MLAEDRHDAPVSSAPQDPATDRWGIDTRWVDAHDQPRTVPAATLAVLRDLIGQPPDDLESVAPVVTGPGRPLGRTVPLPVEVDCEDGVTRQVDTDRLPADFPLGYHRFRGADGELAPADRVARPLLVAARVAGLGARGAAVRHPVVQQLGHR